MKLFHRIGHINIVGSLVLLLGTVQMSLAQSVEKNAEGERIVKYEDGTWRYFEGADSLLLQNASESGKGSKSKVRTDSMPKPIIYNYRLFQRYIAAAVQYESRMLDRVDDSSGEVHNLEDRIIASEVENNIPETTSLRAELELLELRRQDEQRILSHARALIKRVLKVGKSEKYERLAKISIPEFNPSKIEPTHPNVPEEEITPMHQFLPVDDEIYTLDEPEDTSLQLVETEASAPEDLEPEEKLTIPVDTMHQERELLAESDRSETKEEKELVNMSDEQPNIADREVDSPIAQEEEETGEVAVNPSPSTKQDSQMIAVQVEDTGDDKDTTSLEESKIDILVEAPVADVALEEPLPNDAYKTDSIKQLEPEADPSVEDSTAPEVRIARPAPTFTASMQERWFSPAHTTVPAYECEFAYNGIDQITNKQKRELKEEIFFTHTDERLKPYLKDRDYVTCGGYLTSISGGFRYLTLIVRIASRNAVREYGSVRSGSLLNLKLLNGETVSLFSSADHQGAQDPKSGDTLYKVRYPIDYQKEKLLTKSGIDKVRIVWSSGYEDYEVYNVNFFSNQLDCLNGK